MPQGLLPALLQRGGHPAVGRVDGLRAPFRQVDLLPCPLPLLLPRLLQPCACALNILPGLETQLSRGGL